MAFQGLVRWILPKEDRFYDLLERQAGIGREAAKALSKFDGAESAADVRTAVQNLEHDGDKLVHEMEDALARTFVTPLDREDLHKLSSELDDVIDFTNLAMRACVLYGVDRPSEAMQKLVRILVECTEVLNVAIPKLRTHDYAPILEDCRTIRKLEKDGDAVYRGAVSVLFHDPAVDAKLLLKEKEILEDLENAIDHCDHVAETLSNVAVKNG